MKNLFFALLFCLFCSYTANSQIQLIRSGPTLPAACTPGPPNARIFIKTGSSPGIYWCSALHTWTGPLGASGGGIGDALIANPLSQFAPTTSLQLATVLTNETGSGLAVFGTSPIITTPSGIVKGDVGLSNVDNTSDATKNAATVSLTNKTIDGDLNTVLDLPASTVFKAGTIIPPANILTVVNSRCVRINGSGVLEAHSGDCGSGGGSPGGSDTQLQRNNSSAFGGISGATSDGTNVTFGSTNLRATRPRFITSIDDTNGNEVIDIGATASAVNQFKLSNSAAGNPIILEATGGDTDISITLAPKGAGTVNIGDPSATTSYLDLLASADPSTPASGLATVYVDTNKTLKVLDDAGAASSTVRADTGASNNFLTAISADGVISKAQPAFTNISGVATTAQVVTGTATASRCLRLDASSNIVVYSGDCGSGGGTPGGSDTHVQFNDGGAFGGDADFVWNKTANTLTVGGAVTGVIGLFDTDASHYLNITPGSNLTALRTLTLITGDADRSITLTGNTSLAGTNTGDQTITLTGDVTGTGTGSFAATIADNSVDGTDIALGSDAQGDVMYYNGTDWVRLAPGASGQFLKTLGAAANPIWDTPTGSGTVSASTAGYVAYYTGTTTVGGEAAFAYNAGTDTLTVTNLAVGDGTVTGEAKLFELAANGNDYFSWLGQDSRATILRARIPSADPAAGDVMLFGAPSSTISTVTFGSLSSISGAVTDGQVPNTITIDLAAAATALQTSRTIGGVSFNGTANITVASATGGFAVSGGNLTLGTDLGTIFDEHASAPATPAAGTIILYGKQDGLLYSKDDAGAETVVSGGGGSGTPGGSNTQVQFNDSSAFGGDADFVWNKTTNVLTVGGAVTGVIGMLDTNATHYLNLTPGSNLTADRTLTFTTGDADRNLTLTGDASLSGTNTGDQTNLTGISFTVAQLNTAISDADVARTDAANTFTGVQTMTSPALTTPLLTGLEINDASSTHQYVFTASELTADRNVTLPLLTGDDTVTFNQHAATLLNKILTSPTIGTSAVFSTDAFAQFDEHASAPGTPASGNVVLYAKADGLLYSKDDAGTETVVTGGGGGGSQTPWASAIDADGFDLNDGGNITLRNAKALRTDVTASDTLLLQARDVDGAAYTTFITLTAGNTPTANLSGAVTLGGQAITLGGAFTTSGANALTLTTTGSTNVTLPTSGTLITSASLPLQQINMLNTTTLPDSSGNVFLEPYSIKATNDFWKQANYIFNDTATDDALFGSFELPAGCASGSTITMVWTSTAITNTIRYTFSYRVITADDTNSLDQATSVEDVTITDTAPGATNRRMAATFTPTNSNFATAGTVEWKLIRTGTTTDNLAAAVQLISLRFSCTP